ncbi:MAG: SH3 domain-containing protein [Phototrophicaceae bacterium]
MRYIGILIVLLMSMMNTVAQSPSATECPDDFVGYLSPQLIVGERARVVIDIQLNVRPEPSVNEARLGTLEGGTHVTVLDDPVCDGQFIWWRIESDDLSGWVAEGILQNEIYFIEPRGEQVIIETSDGVSEPYIRTATGFLEPEGCLRPPDDYEQVQLDFATLNQRTLFMLDNAQRIYDANGGTWANFRWLITQGSYNQGGVAASFGTHDAGGAVDISVIDTQNGWVVMRDEVPAMLRALRIAGFAAWLRDTDELYDGSIVHIHAIAIGDEEASEIAQAQVSSDFGYLSGYNGLPPEDYGSRIPDIYGDPIICEWMVDDGFDDLRD